MVNRLRYRGLEFLLLILASSCAALSSADDEPYVSKEDYERALQSSPNQPLDQSSSNQIESDSRAVSNGSFNSQNFPENSDKKFNDNKENFRRNSGASWEDAVQDEFKKGSYQGSEPYQEFYLKKSQANQRQFANELPPKEVLPERTKPRLYYINPMNAEAKNPPNQNTPYPSMLGGFNPQPSSQYYNPYSTISQSPRAPTTNFLNSTEVQDPVIQLPRWQETDYYYADKIFY